MPISHEIDAENRLVVARASGVLTHDDIVAYQRDVWSQEEVLGFDEIVDVSGVDRIAFESSRRVSEIAAIAAERDSKSDPSRLAIVAPTPETYGLARMYQTFRETTPGSTRSVNVVRTLAEAHKWLGK
jgi:hypothetical protein